VAKASVLGANAAVNGQSVNQGLGNSVLTEYKVYVNPYLVVTPFQDWMDYTKHYYMGAIRVASEFGGTPCFDPSVVYTTVGHIRPKRFSVAKKRSGDFLGGSPILLMTKKAKAPLREPSYYSRANCIAAAQRFF